MVCGAGKAGALVVFCNRAVRTVREEANAGDTLRQPAEPIRHKHPSVAERFIDPGTKELSVMGLILLLFVFLPPIIIIICDRIFSRMDR